MAADAVTTTRLKVTGLPESITNDELEQFFIQRGIDTLKEVTVDSRGETAVIEFLDNSDVQAVLKEPALCIFGTTVDVKPIEEEYSDSDDAQLHSDALQSDEENDQSTTIIVTGLPKQTATSKCISTSFENKNGQGSGKVREVTIAGDRKSAIVEFEDASVFEHNTHIKPIIEELGLSSYGAGSISVKDITTIDPHKNKTSVDLKQRPWILLRRLLCVNSDAMDLRCKQDNKRSSAKEGKRSVDALFESPKEREGISPLDIFLLVFQCCDPMLKQLLYHKMFMCKMAVPFVYRNYFTLQSTLSMWPLRFHVIDSKSKAGENIEVEILDMQTKIVTCARFGRPKFSKSKLLNLFLSDTVADTFFNMDSPHGTLKRVTTDGYIEMALLPTICNTHCNFNDAITFMNMRGDIRTFQDNECEFTSTVTDIAVIVCDLRAILDNCKYVKQYVVKFSAIILVIADKIDPNDLLLKTRLTDFEDNVKRGNSIKIHITSTYNGLQEKSATEISTTVTAIINRFFETIPNKSKSLQERLQHVNGTLLKSDECETCLHAKKKAFSVFKMMEREATEAKGFFHSTPAQRSESLKLSSLLKQLHIERDFTKHDDIKKEMKDLRVKQTKGISRPMDKIIYYIKRFGKSSCFIQYFVKWLTYCFDQKKRIILLDLMKKKQVELDKHWKMKKEGKCSVNDLSKLESTINRLEGQIYTASFGIENIFREIYHICDAILHLKVYKVISLEGVNSLADAIACMVCDGQAFELLDGTSFYMPTEWIKLVLNKIHEQIGQKKVLTLSVLGLQSSGKSTMLNTMFGVQFATSLGRCTKGIHMQLIPMKKPEAVGQRPFDYVLVIDTEGLRAPELSTKNYKRDNELATIITGLGDLTLLNVMGENMTELRDILQILIHAFLRLKLANERLDIEKSCFFIHQNVADAKASEKMKTGLQHSIKNLDSATEESALTEGISNITTFNQVIEFDTENNVWYLPNLWQGNPPLARVNRKYSESVVGIFENLILRALSNTAKSYKSLNDIVVHTEDLWKGVLAEDFVFSFRNSLEKRAYIALETKFKEEMWYLEKRIEDEFYDLSQKRFSQCDNKDSLSDAKTFVIKEIKHTAALEEASLTERMNLYFGNNNFKDITIQWKHHTIVQIRDFCKEVIYKNIQEVNSILNKRAVDIMTNSMHKIHEEQLRQSTIDVANELKGKDLTQEEINKRFEDVWNMFVSDTLKEYKSKKSQSTLEHEFIEMLTNMFNNHPCLLDILTKQPLHESNPIIFKLSGSFAFTKISDKDISVKTKYKQITDKEDTFRNFKLLFHDQSFTVARNELEMTFKNIDLLISSHCIQDKEIAYRDIKSFLMNVKNKIEQIPSEQNFSLKITFKIKAMIFVSRVALVLFDKHNRDFNKVHGIEVRLAKYKQQVKERFDAHLADCKAEETASKLFRFSIEDFLYEAVKDKLPLMVKRYLQCQFPPLKYNLIVDMLTDLVHNDQFTDWVHYIEMPTQFSEKWLTDKSERILFNTNNGKYYEMAVLEIDNYMAEVNASIRESGRRLKSSPLTIHVWIDTFISNLKTYKVPKECFRDVIRELEAVDEIHLEYFTDVLMQNLQSSCESIGLKFGKTGKETIRWTTFNPYKALCGDIWGCHEKCIFCGEPCMRCKNHSGYTHSCIQHRPSGCKGTHQTGSLNISLTSCNFKVVSNLTAKCCVYKYLCNKPNQTPCAKETHPYTQYRLFLPDWDIEPSNDMEDRSKFWMWFMATYKENLQNYYRVDVSNIPESWGDILKEDALESLRSVYC